MFTYCPACASPSIRFERERVFRCADCGFVYYHNNAAAVAGIIDRGGALLLLERAKEPARGKLAFPGGFVDPGEGAVEALRRECLEEIGFDPGSCVQFFASFPNVYPYRGIVYRTCDLFFTGAAPDLKKEDLHPDPHECAGIHVITYSNLNEADLAFESARQALRLFCAGLR
ncbi:MAG: NUDIX domain-containing protein [Spirochaetaceae bacterium]|jgi:ADP-ribose pyrophosphatase YjhB (NUDIX family)|nr:NUDIX domain-containing protein [Spirochaetaceae bacterium]